VSGKVAAERQPIISQQGLPPGVARSWLVDSGVSAFACFPLLADGRLLGTLAFGTRRRASFREDELQVMRVVCDQVAMAMERARLIAELQQRAADLAEADRRKDEFLAMLAHELRNPLAPMLNAVHLLRLHDKRENEAEREAIQAMWRQIHHMIRLVDDLLDVSRITSGKIYLKKEPARLDQVVEHAIQTSRPLIESRRHTLSVSLPPEPIWLLADFTRLAQVIANLLNNAAKYTDEGGSVWLTATREGATIVLRVRDTGIGLSREMLSRVFDLFVQAERGVARSQGGLGLGLTLVRTLVEMHGGSVSASSEGIGRGSEFVVRLPIDEEAALAAQRAQAANGAGAAKVERPAPSKAPLRVLVVDDNGDIRETLKDLLELCGHEVHVAEDGMSAAELTLSLRPDVALIDIGLPGLDGYQVAEKLRAEMRGDKRTRLIALTGYGQADDRLRALAAGFDAHLVKPVDFDRLSELLADPGVSA
jgi:signal transduction histidine kinase